MGGVETIRAFNREETFVARFRVALHQTLVAQESSVRYNAFFTPVTSLLSALVIAALLWVGAGGLLGVTGVGLGTLTAFVPLFQRFFAPIVALGDQWNSVQAALAGAERVFEVLNLQPEESPPEEPELGRGSGIVLRDVSFGYNEQSSVLHGISLIVRAGRAGRRGRADRGR